MTREPVGSTGGGRHAPMMLPDDEPRGASHWCDAVGSTVYAPKIDCEWCGDEGGDDDGE